jgi:hypothetical protein
MKFFSRLKPWRRTEQRLNNNDLIRLRKYLQTVIERETKNCAKQVMASAACESYFTSGFLPSFNPESHKWPVSPDFAFYLIELLETGSYDIIVEFGSGHSTVLVSRVLAQMSFKPRAKTAAPFLSFDHLPEYYKRTQVLLDQAGTREFADLPLLFVPERDSGTCPKTSASSPQSARHRGRATFKHR